MRVISLFIIGKGTIGKALLAHILSVKRGLEAQGIDLKISAIAGSKQVLFRSNGITSGVVSGVIENNIEFESIPGISGNGGWDDLLFKIREDRSVNKIVVDVTAEETGEMHLKFLREGWSVVTANKKPISGSGDLFSSLTRRYGRI